MLNWGDVYVQEEHVKDMLREAEAIRSRNQQKQQQPRKTLWSPKTLATAVSMLVFFHGFSRARLG